MARIRLWHSYIGLFIAPSVLFFALTGSVQLFSLHEAHGDYHPAAIVEKLSSIHKDQVFALGDHHPAPDTGPHPGDESQPPAGPEEHGDEPAVSTLILKGYFLLVAIALTLSTAFGLCMGLTHTPRKRVGWLLVVAGTMIPMVLLLV
jgi:hypothetical protein